MPTSFLSRFSNILPYFVLVVLWLLPTEATAQCAMCRAVLESEANQSTAKGINDGIVYLMAIPYVLIAGIGIVIYRKMKYSNKN